tara:strand:- start:1612 stop:2346 length:735 start_codon:yes stop_codon:yes gene_type:complete
MEQLIPRSLDALKADEGNARKSASEARKSRLTTMTEEPAPEPGIVVEKKEPKKPRKSRKPQKPGKPQKPKKSRVTNPKRPWRNVELLPPKLGPRSLSPGAQGRKGKAEAGHNLRHEEAREVRRNIPKEPTHYPSALSPRRPSRSKRRRRRSKKGGTVDKRSKGSKRAFSSIRRKIPRKNQDLKKNEGYYGPIMNKKGKLDHDEICRYCSPADYAKGARKFCKLHQKVWDSKTNACKKSKRTRRR